MKVDRILEIIVYLINHDNVSASYLALNRNITRPVFTLKCSLTTNIQTLWQNIFPIVQQKNLQKLQAAFLLMFPQKRDCGKHCYLVLETK